MRSLPTLLLALLPALATSCGGASAPRPHLVVVLVDQLRKDVADQALPRTRALAERGVIFERARSVAPWTYPSVVSMFSGLYPQEHGATGSDDGKKLTYFSRDVPLVQRSLTRAGYRSAGFVANPFVHTWNPFHEDFTHYDASFINSQGNERGRGDLVWTDKMWGDHLNANLRAHYDAQPLAGPEFTYVHYIDVHGRRKGPDRWDGAPFESSLTAACGFVDERIVELYEYFHARYDGNLVFVVTSDHGEELGDDEHVGPDERLRVKKASVHEFNLRIPLWVLAGKPVPGGRVVEEPVLNMDLAPTLLAWGGVSPSARLSARSLVPAIEGGTTGPPRPLYARMDAWGYENDCVIYDEKKLLRFFDPRDHSVRVREAFDVERDPRELHLLDPVPEAGGQRLEVLVDQVAAGAGRYESTFTEPSEGQKGVFEDLGYTGEGDLRRRDDR